jgi:DNA-binding transcriptional LysR family regulator
MTRWSFHQLQTFRVFGETLSMTETAQRTFVSQPAVSQKLKELEASAGMKLFFRKGNRVLLTPEGVALLPVIERIFEQIGRLDRTIGELQRADAGEMVILAMSPLLQNILPDAIAVLSEQKPKLSLAVEATSAPEILGRIRRDVADIGFTLSVEDDTGLVLDPFMRVSMIAILPSDHPLAGSGRLEYGQLADQRLVVHSPQTPLGRVMASALKDEDHPGGLIRVNHSAVAMELVARGLGVALTHPLGIKFPIRPDLAILPVHPQVTFTATMVVSRQRPLSSATETFMQIVRGIASDYIGHLRQVDVSAEFLKP